MKAKRLLLSEESTKRSARRGNGSSSILSLEQPPFLRCRENFSTNETMAHVSIITFVASIVESDPTLISGKRVLEIGSLGPGVRPVIMALGPREYIGVDYCAGPGVDLVLNAERLPESFPANRFDAIISTETLEHVADWKRMIEGIRTVLTPGGVAVITTRSQGYPYHASRWYGDYWRFSTDDLRAMFDDFDRLAVRPDEQAPGVFLLAFKPTHSIPVGVPTLSIYSMSMRRRIARLPHPPVGTLKFLQLYASSQASLAFHMFKGLVNRDSFTNQTSP